MQIQQTQSKIQLPALFGRRISLGNGLISQSTSSNPSIAGRLWQMLHETMHGQAPEGAAYEIGPDNKLWLIYRSDIEQAQAYKTKIRSLGPICWSQFGADSLFEISDARHNDDAGLASMLLTHLETRTHCKTSQILASRIQAIWPAENAIRSPKTLH